MECCSRQGAALVGRLASPVKLALPFCPVERVALSRRTTSCERQPRGRHIFSMFCVGLLVAWFPFGGLHKWGYPELIHFHRIFPYKPFILGVPPWLWNPQFVLRRNSGQVITSVLLRIPWARRLKHRIFLRWAAKL